MKVSCIMPTAGRRKFVPRAIAYFLAQTYRKKELIIMNDGDDSIEDLIPDDPPSPIRLFECRTGGRRSVGALRNDCIDVASGSFVAHWDDDDWSAPGRLAAQVAIVEAGDAEITGYHDMLFHDSRGRLPEIMRYDAAGPGYALGTSLFYRWAFAKANRFEEIDVGEDNRFQMHSRVHTVSSIEPEIMMAARIHPGTNTAKTTPAAVRAGHQPNWSMVEDPAVLAYLEAILQ